jgi:subtilisin family serine protease
MATVSGTSMASPHVAGVMAVMLSEQNFTPSKLKQEILFWASSDIIAIPKDDQGTPSNLLYLKIGGN